MNCDRLAVLEQLSQAVALVWLAADPRTGSSSQPSLSSSRASSPPTSKRSPRAACCRSSGTLRTWSRALQTASRYAPWCARGFGGRPAIPRGRAVPGAATSCRGQSGRGVGVALGRPRRRSRVLRSVQRGAARPLPANLEPSEQRRDEYEHRQVGRAHRDRTVWRSPTTPFCSRTSTTFRIWGRGHYSWLTRRTRLRTRPLTR